MGGCLCKTFTVNRTQDTKLRCIQPFIFSIPDAESVLMESNMGDYLLYRDHVTDRIVLSVRYNSHIRNHRISEQDGLYFLNGQPYPYLDSIVLYHRKHRLDNIKLMKQAHLSARVVRLFAHKITNTNGNNIHAYNNENARRVYTEINGTSPPTSQHFNSNPLANGTTNHSAHDTATTRLPPFENNNTTSAVTPQPTTTNVGLSHLELNSDERPATPVILTYINDSSPSQGKKNHVTGSKIEYDVAENEDQNGVMLSSLKHLDSYSNLNVLNTSTVSSQASLLSGSPPDSYIEIERF